MEEVEEAVLLIIAPLVKAPLIKGTMVAVMLSRPIIRAVAAVAREVLAVTHPTVQLAGQVEQA
jgi:hypothetical protein